MLHPVGCMCPLCYREINRAFNYKTPEGSFSAGFDNIHKHTYPEKHGGNEFGANLVQTDLLTGKKKVTGSFELNILKK